MLSKCLEKKVQLTQEGNHGSEGNNIELEYYLLESEVQDDKDILGDMAYGIEIVKTVTSIKVEKEVIRNVSCCRESVAKILDMLATNTVTPIGLPFIMDDLIGV